MEFDTTSIILLVLIIIFIVLTIREQYLRTPDAHPLLLNSQSDVAPVRQANETAVYRNKFTPNGMRLMTEPPMMSFGPPGSRIRTVLDIWKVAITNRSAKFGTVEADLDHPNTVVYEVIDKFNDKIINFGRGLMGLGRFTKGDVIGIYLSNCSELLVADLACMHFGLVPACIPPLNSPRLEDLVYAITITKMKCIIVGPDTENRVQSVLSQCEGLQIIRIGDEFNNIMKEGQARNDEIFTAKPEDLATICFTRGSTGKWKGVELTHGNIAAGVAGLLATLPLSDRPNETDIYFSLTSFAFCFERIVLTTLVLCGVRVVFTNKKVEEIWEDIRVIRPTIITGSSDVLTNFQTRHPPKGRFFKRAYATKLFWLQEEGRVVRDSLWDWIAFKDIREDLGGQIRLILTSSSSVKQGILDFLRVTLGCPVLHGYGTTEAAGGITMSMYNDYQSLEKYHEMEFSHVGPPMPNVEIKLVDSGEYRADDVPNPRGEIWIRGPSVMRGYVGEPELTRLAFDEQKWHNTGDLGLMLPNGTMRYIGKVKTENM